MTYFLVFVLCIFSWWLPWWWVAPLFFFVGRRCASARVAFARGFFAVMLVWGPVTYYSDLKAFGLISRRVSEMFSLPWAWSSYLLVAVLGGLFAGLWAYMGHVSFQYRMARRS